MAGFVIDADEIDNRFGYHPVNDVTIGLHQQVRAAAIEFGNLLAELLPESREKSLAFTELQTCTMWAGAAIACNLAELELGK
jgi:hypothetical protein